MAKGDHVYVYYPGFTHHGIDCGAAVAYNLSKKEDSNTSKQLQVYTISQCPKCYSKNRFPQNTQKTPLCGNCKQALLSQSL